LAEAGFRQARRILLFMAGMTVVLIGTLLIFTPAPGSVVILGGLSILAAEFAWARRWRIQLEEAIAVALTRLRENLEALNDEM
jgi:tellurite resistance protein TerC